MGLQRMTMQNAVNREFLNIQIKRGKILGNSRIIVETEKYITKYYFNPKVFDDTKKCTQMIKEFHPHLFLDFYDCNDHMCVTINKIDCLDGDHRSKAKKSGTYRSNIKNYLQLYKCFGNKFTKRDLTPDNIIYRKSDLKWWIIDWDNVRYFDSDEHCYNFYKEQLCDWRWSDWFELDRKKLEEIFQEEWKIISS